jgi:hypothetical protein
MRSLKEYTPAFLCLEEVALLVGHKVLMEVDYISLIVGKPHRILDQQLSPCLFQLLDIVIKLIFI